MPTQTTTKKTAVKQPQDRKPKQADLAGFEFTGADGETYTLPAAQPYVENAPLRLTRAMMRAERDNDTAGQFIIAMDVLDLLEDEHAEARDAVLDLPTEQGAEVIQGWLNAADEDEVSAGESSGSSD